MTVPDSKRPTPGRAWVSQDSVQVCGVERSEVSESATHAQWETARDLERGAARRARAALMLRGAERLQQCAIATALALAARNAALSAGAAR